MNTTSFAIRNQWKEYRKAVVPAGAPAEQVEECQRAFYAGAQSMLHVNAAIAELDMELAVPALTAVQEELSKFADEVLVSGIPPAGGVC